MSWVAIDQALWTCLLIALERMIHNVRCVVLNKINKNKAFQKLNNLLIGYDSELVFEVTTARSQQKQ